MVVRIVQAERRTGADLPDDDQLERLARIVAEAHGTWLAQDFGLAELRSAAWTVARFWRTPKPSTSKYFVYFVDEANEMLSRAGVPSISAPAFMAACLAAGDVPWQKPDGSIGVLLSVGLDSTYGLASSNVWRAILAGERGPDGAGRDARG